VKARPEDAALSADLVDANTGAVKMSKSLGNVKWLREMIWPEGPYDPMAVRMMMLSSHYRSPIVFEPAMLDEATARLERIYNTLEKVALSLDKTYLDSRSIEPEPLKLAFDSAMNDDFNTAGALGIIFDMCTIVNQELTKDMRNTEYQFRPAFLRWQIIELLQVLGIRPTRAKATAAGDSEKLVDLLMQSRQDARAAKAYQLGDKIRDGIKGLGYEVEDLPGGKWSVKKK